jgi:hypothetical protein
MLIRLGQHVDFSERLKTIIPKEDLISDKITFADPDMGGGQLIDSIIGIVNQKNIKKRIFGYNKNLFHTKIIEGTGGNSVGNFKYGEISESADYVVSFPEMKPNELKAWVDKMMKFARKGLIVVANIKPILSKGGIKELSKLIILEPILTEQTMQTPLAIYFFKKGTKTINVYDEISGHNYKVNSINDISQFSYNPIFLKIRDKIKQYCENYYSLSDIMHDTKWTNREYKKYRYISTWPARRGHSNPQIDKGVWFGNDMYNPYSENGDAHTGQPTTKYPNVPTCRNCFSFKEKNSFHNLNRYSQTAWFRFAFAMGKYDQGQSHSNFQFIPVFDIEFKTNVTRNRFMSELNLTETEMKWIEKVMKPYM